MEHIPMHQKLTGAVRALMSYLAESIAKFPDFANG